MHSNTFGNLLRLTTFGESHGAALGAVIDGMPAGVALTPEHIAAHLARRRPGQSAITTARDEKDAPQILSGVFEGKTIGSPICVVIWNEDQRSHNYDPLFFRAGHADRTWEEKFGHRDHRGGGRASGRETAARVIGGAVAERILPEQISIVGFTRQIGEHQATNVPVGLTRERVDQHSTRCPDLAVATRIEAELLECKALGDSRGGIVELWIDGLPVGLGEPVFRKIKNTLANAMMSVGAVVGVTLGDAASDCTKSGFDFHSGESGYTPESGYSPSANGIQGGMSNGQRIRLLAYFKPASTVGAMATEGRHDPCIVPRAVPVLEAMAALVIADHFLEFQLNRAQDLTRL
ncbi:MAG: chorismate synthase [Bradymonadaceae bacterium]|nr:chorismate synthase [Lujinxingiaceae bacterium]